MLCSDFDPDRKAVINPEDNFSPLPGFPQMCMGVYSQPIVESLLQRFGGEEILALRFCSGPVPVYRVRALGQEFALFVPHVGGAASGSMMEELAAHGGRCFVFFGSCGVLRGEITDGHLILPTAAVRDEGLSYHYLPPAREVSCDPNALQQVKDELERLSVPYQLGKTWTTDAIYRETEDKIALRASEGCLTVEMECAAFFAVSRFLSLPLVQLLYAGDDLSGESWDQRAWNQQYTTRENLLRLSIMLAGRL